VCNLPICCRCSTGDPIGPNTTPLLYSLYGSIAQKVDTTRFGNRQHLVEVVARVKEVLADSIVLDRALPVSITPGWKDASVHTFAVTGAEGPVSLGLSDGELAGAESAAVPVVLARPHYRSRGRDQSKGLAGSSTKPCLC
jgi:hypothetical protein